MALAGVDWGTVGILVGSMASLTTVPLVFVAMYLRSLREQQVQGTGESTRRVQAVEEDLRAVRRCLGRFEQEFTRKEEWLRESMHARQQLERLTEMMARVESQLENSDGLAGQMGRAISAMVELTRQLARGRES